MTRDAFDAVAPPDRGRFGENEQQPRKGVTPRVTGAMVAKFGAERNGAGMTVRSSRSCRE